MRIDLDAPPPVLATLRVWALVGRVDHHLSLLGWPQSDSRPAHQATDSLRATTGVPIMRLDSVSEEVVAASAAGLAVLVTATCLRNTHMVHDLSI